METITTARACSRLGELLGVEINPQKFHRLAAKHAVSPVLEAPGLRGAKFWNSRDVERIARAEGAVEGAA